jgi:adenylosuccinate synthase
MSIDFVCDLVRGDSGKGRVVDFFSQNKDSYQLHLRVTSGDNCGHTCQIGDELYKLHHIPSSIFSGQPCLLCGDMIINPERFCKEVEDLNNRGINTSNLWIDGIAHINFPLYSEIDGQEENERGIAIGTTRHGIGPCYAAKYARLGMQYYDVINLSKEDFYNKVIKLYKIYLVKSTDDEIKSMIDNFYPSLLKMKSMIVDGRQMVREAIIRDDNILAEGSQGTFLDINHGIYPFVTSSCCTAASLCTGTGIAIREVDRIIGVTKAYSTYVGNGPYLEECDLDNSHILQTVGKEIGTTTSRIRRCGWLNAPALKTAMDLNSVTDIVLSKLDIIGVLPEIKIVTHYQHPNGSLIDYVPSNPAVLAACKPVYEILPGWGDNITNAKSLADLPKNARDYISFIEDQIDFPIAYISVGPERDQMFFTG